MTDVDDIWYPQSLNRKITLEEWGLAMIKGSLWVRLAGPTGTMSRSRSNHVAFVI